MRFNEYFRGSKGFGGAAGAGDNDGADGRVVKARKLREEKKFGGGKGARRTAGEECPGRCGGFGEIETGAAAEEEHFAGGGEVFRGDRESGGCMQFGSGKRPEIRLRKNLAVGVAGI